MIFKRISHVLALRFTGFVFILLFVTGIVFLIADVENAKKQTQQRLGNTARAITQQIILDPKLLPLTLPPPYRDRVRFLDQNAEPIYTGELFQNVAFVPVTGLSHVTMAGEQYGVLTMKIEQAGIPQGYVQLADLERLQWREIPRRAGLFLVVSGAISLMTYLVGLSFARRSLVPAERMVQQLEQFTQDASHEIRTPLAALNSSLDLALKTKKYKEGIESAKEDVKQLAGLTERLLELARLDTFTVQKERLDFSPIVTQSVERYQPLAEEKQLHISSSITSQVFVQGDGALLRQIAENLISNAVKYSPAGSNPIMVQLTSDSLVVSDHGVGISEEALPHIFDRFYQEDGSRAHGGFGLGLSLVKRIVDLHGWSIGIKSAPAKGTTVVVRFGSRKTPKAVS